MTVWTEQRVLSFNEKLEKKFEHNLINIVMSEDVLSLQRFLNLKQSSYQRFGNIQGNKQIKLMRTDFFFLLIS